MEKLNRNQFIGIGIVPIGIITSFLFEGILVGVLSGALTAVGVALIFKWIPFRKKKSD